MSTQPPTPPGGPEGQQPTNVPGSFTQEIRHSNVSARVPEKVARGVFSTGALVLQGQHEFLIDFVLRVSQPHQLVTRVILPPAIMPSLIHTLRENLGHYQARFGAPPALPTPPPGTPIPTIEEIYQGLKYPDETLTGVYANAVLITHTPSEFGFDFITSCYPRPVVGARVFLAAPQVPVLLNNLAVSFQQYQQKLAAARQQQQQHPPGEPRPPTAG